MLRILLAISLFLLPTVKAVRCALCDSFQGYCDLEGSICVGSLCATRIATLDQGLIRVQKLCVPSDSPLGCRPATLWKGLQGRECICSGDLCNGTTTAVRNLLFFLVFFVFL